VHRSPCSEHRGGGPARDGEGNVVERAIRKITLADGSARYRLVVDIRQDPTGKRQQLTRTFDRLKEAWAELSRVRHRDGPANLRQAVERPAADGADEIRTFSAAS
jgi:hypothetical protein